MSYPHYFVCTLGEFYEVQQEVRRYFWYQTCKHCPAQDEDKNKCLECFYEKTERNHLPVWYRGHEESSHLLLPSLLRPPKPDWTMHGNSTSIARDKSNRMQAFFSRAYHVIPKIPETNYDYNEIMQHHFTETDLLDWTEKAEVGMAFALESYLDPKKSEGGSPTVWALAPATLNALAYQKLQNPEALHNALAYLNLAPFKKWKLRHKLEDALKHTDVFWCMDLCNQPNLNGIISLAVLNMIRQEAGENYILRLQNLEINPYHWLLLRYYCDALPAPLSLGLTGIATLQTYHSRRIENQHGVFTALPNYRISEDGRPVKGSLHQLAMEVQPNAEAYLAKIVLVEPDRIATELLQAGVIVSGIYQDLDRYSHDLQRKIRSP